MPDSGRPGVKVIIKGAERIDLSLQGGGGGGVDGVTEWVNMDVDESTERRAACAEDKTFKCVQRETEEDGK